MLANPMFLNQLGTLFEIQPSWKMRDDTWDKPATMFPSVGQMRSQMLANTFPPVYQTSTIRPSSGQLFPLSGALPY